MRPTIKGLSSAAALTMTAPLVLGGGSAAPVAATITTTTTQPVCSRLEPAVRLDSVEYADRLVRAWGRGDRGATECYATTSTVRSLFAHATGRHSLASHLGRGCGRNDLCDLPRRRPRRKRHRWCTQRRAARAGRLARRLQRTLPGPAIRLRACGSTRAGRLAEWQALSLHVVGTGFPEWVEGR